MCSLSDRDEQIGGATGGRVCHLISTSDDACLASGIKLGRSIGSNSADLVAFLFILLLVSIYIPLNIGNLGAVVSTIQTVLDTLFRFIACQDVQVHSIWLVSLGLYRAFSVL